MRLGMSESHVKHLRQLEAQQHLNHIMLLEREPMLRQRG